MFKPWNIPKKPVGSDPFRIWAQRVHDYLFNELVFNDSPTVKASKTNNGIYFDSSGGGGAGAVQQLCAITELFGTDEDKAYDYIGVTPYDAAGSTLSGAQFLCAKCVTGRGPENELIDGDIETYSDYILDNQRLDTLPDDSTEFHAMHPRYIVYPGPPPYPDGFSLEQCLVYVSRTQNPTGVKDSTGADIYYLEMQPNRYWAWSPSLNGS